jgi:transposase InsO family protein
MEFTYLLVLKDGFSHFCELIPCASANHSVVVDALLQWFSRFGTVQIWISDQGSHFKNAIMAALNEKLQTKHHFTLANCPWSNGTIERLNRDI